MAIIETKESLFEEAKRRYPVGTKFKVVHQPSHICTVSSHDKYEKTTYSNHINLLVSDSNNSRGATVYMDGKWAEILSKPEEIPKTMGPKKEERIHIFNNIYVGDIVVSLTSVGHYRKEGDIIKSLDKSFKGELYYQDGYASCHSKEWRLATPEEIEAYNKGIKNIKDIVMNTYGLKVGDKLPAIVLNAWGNDKNYLISGKNIWQVNSSYCGDRSIEAFETKESETVFRISGTSTCWGRAEGFKEFMEEFNKPKIVELSSLPEKWCIRVERDCQNSPEVLKWRKDRYFGGGTTPYIAYDETWYPHKPDNLVEINFEQFKKWVLKEQKADMCEYYECIASNDPDSFTEGKVYKALYPHNLEASGNFIDDKGTKNGWSGDNYKHFKPSTLAAYEAQNKPKVDVVPEYVECIKQVGYCKVGGVFKSKQDDRFRWLYEETNSNALKFGEWDAWKEWSECKEHFKPSTKEAYNKQSAPKQAIEEKWCVECTAENKEAVNKYFHSIGKSYVGYNSGWEINVGVLAYYPQYSPDCWANSSRPNKRKEYKTLSTEEFYAKIGHKVEEKMEDLTGRWLKVVTKRLTMYDCKVGTYLKFHSRSGSTEYWGHTGNMVGVPWYFGTNAHKMTDDFELMPLGWNPDGEFKVGDWVYWIGQNDTIQIGNSVSTKGVTNINTTPEYYSKYKNSYRKCLPHEIPSGTYTISSGGSLTTSNPNPRFEIGDTVRCIHPKNGKGIIGCGWEKNREFVVDRIDRYSSGDVLWATRSENLKGGVFSRELEIVNRSSQISKENGNSVERIEVSITDVFKPKKSVKMSYFTEATQQPRTLSKINKTKHVTI